MGARTQAAQQRAKHMDEKMTALSQNISFLPHVVLLFLPLTGPAFEQVKINKLRFKCLPTHPKLAN
jgi:hypothetical protein